MSDLLTRYRRILLVLVLVLQPLILILLGRDMEQPEFGVLGGALYQAVAASQNATYQVIGGIGDLFDDYFHLVEVNRENQALRLELARLEEERIRLLGVMQENARLRAMVGFAEANPQLQLRPARVIAKNISPYFRVLRLRLDAGEGIARPNMPVVAPSGLVGQVISVAGDYCDVLLTVDTDSRIDILVQRNRARGVLEGDGSDDEYRARVSYLLEDDDVAVGDVLVTSGYGGRFPREIVIGRIVEVESQSSGMFQEVLVRPTVDFSRLDEVYLVTGLSETL